MPLSIQASARAFVCVCVCVCVWRRNRLPRLWNLLIEMARPPSRNSPERRRCEYFTVNPSGQSKNNQHFMEPTASLPPTVPNLSQINPVDTPSSTYFKSILILFHHQHLDFPHDFFPSGFLVTLCTHFFFSYMPWSDHTNIIWPVWTPRHRWQENIKAGPKQKGWGGVDCILLADNSDNRRSVGHLVMNLRILDFKLSPCSECCILSFGWSPDVWNSDARESPKRKNRISQNTGYSWLSKNCHSLSAFVQQLLRRISFIIYITVEAAYYNRG